MWIDIIHKIEDNEKTINENNKYLHIYKLEYKNIFIVNINYKENIIIKKYIYKY